MKSILDPTFRYIPSFSTDLRSTFEKVRRELRKTCPPSAEASQNVLPIARKRADGVTHAVGV
jgi:hypothetical protein